MSNPHIIKTLFLKAPREKVWAYLTDKDKLAEWFHASDTDLRAGSDYALLGDDGNGLCRGNVQEASPPDRLVYTFTHDWLKGVETTVTWELKEAHGGTMLTLTHEGFENAPVDVLDALCDHDKGWDEHFARLREAIVA